MSKVTQKKAAFYTLYREFREAKALPEAQGRINAFRFIPTWEFVGEIHIPELGVWVMRSYKCPTRLTDIYQENPGLLERKLIIGKSGSKYYGYRFSAQARAELIKDETLREFYKSIKGKQVTVNSGNLGEVIDEALQKLENPTV